MKRKEAVWLLAAGLLDLARMGVQLGDLVPAQIGWMEKSESWAGGDRPYAMNDLKRDALKQTACICFTVLFFESSVPIVSFVHSQT